MHELGQLMTGGVALAGLLGTIALWAVRRIVRDEIAVALRSHLHPLRTDLSQLHQLVERLRCCLAERNAGWNSRPQKSKEKTHHEELA